jgi:hypothetical protein
MNNSMLSVETLRWQKARRRWTLMLGGLLTVNASLVVIALAGYANTAPQPIAERGPAESAPEATDLAATVPAPAATELPSENPVEQPATSSEVTSPGSGAGDPVATLPSITESTTADLGSSTASLPTALAIDPFAIVVVNPSENGGAVSFLFHDAVFTLEAGEFVSLSACDDTQILYHKGDELDDAQCDCQPGIYVFDVSASGWQLAAPSDVDGAALLSTCRQVPCQ